LFDAAATTRHAVIDLVTAVVLRRVFYICSVERAELDTFRGPGRIARNCKHSITLLHAMVQ
jgi:hypothetical protein